MRRVFLAFLAILLGFLAALAWYVYDHGFTKKWRNYLVDQFRKQGIEISFHRVTLDPFRGLVGEEVKVYDAKGRRRVLAVIDEVMLGVNYANAVRNKTFLDWIDLRDARLSLPLDPSDPTGESVTISHFNARLFLPPERIYLSRAEADIYGVRVQAAGNLINPQDFHFQQGNNGSPGAVLDRIFEELKGLRYDGPRPVLNIEFSGDLANPQQIAVDVRLHAAQIRRKKYQMQHLDMAASCRNGVIELKQLDVADSKGLLHAGGTYDFASREAELRIQSSLDFQELNHAFHFTTDLSDVVFRDPPRFDCTLHAVLGSEPKVRGFGHLALGSFALRSESFTALSADGSWDGDRWCVRDLHLTHRTGELNGDAMQLPGNFRAELRGNMSPKAFLPFLDGVAAEWLSQFDFTDSPVLELSAKGSAFTLDDCHAAGTIRFGRTSYRGGPADGFAHLDYAGRELKLSPFPGERGKQTTIFDFQQDEVRAE